MDIEYLYFTSAENYNSKKGDMDVVDQKCISYC